MATLRLDLSACLVPQAVEAPGCGDALKERFVDQGDGAIPACLAVAAAEGGEGATLPLAVSREDGTLTPRGDAGALSLPGGGGDLAFKLFILDDPDPSLCDPSMFQPDRACDARLPRCLMATKTVTSSLAPDGRLEVAFGGEAHACDFECNDVCPPGASCVSVCHQADPAAGAAGAREACDGRDNDCDGLVDEGCDEDGDGFCAPGVVVADGSDCFGQLPDCDDADEGVSPRVQERCDGVDNDCDGRVDEADDMVEKRACPRAAGACAGSLARCVDGEFADGCGAREYGDDWDGDTEERCFDGVDNDCDGRSDAEDPDCECQAGDADRTCGVDLGACRAGVQECVSLGGEGEGEGEGAGAHVWGPCQGVLRAAEVCDGIDNDCDGTADEALVGEGPDARCPDAGVCVGRRTVCEGGDWVCDFPPEWAPADVVCDGVDEDCDGTTDEGLDAEGLAPPAGLDVCPVDGVCGGGGAAAVCDSRLGRWRCEYPPSGYEPEERSCDQEDNDCDGLVDEACPCAPGEVLPCGTDVGACQPGEQACEDGRWGPCVGGVRPEEETCDGADEDCDGRVDEGVSPVEDLCPDHGVCAGMPTVCAGAEWRCAAEDRQEEETACNGLDDDCDGVVDEPEHLQGPERALCPDRGVCQGRPNACVEGGWRCDRPPEHEGDETRCDGLDNDCDGQVDELPLAPPAQRPCLAAGVCGEARVVCDAGAWACALGPEHEPAAEMACDGRDNDCDGIVDEAADGAGPLRLPCYEGSPETRGAGVCVDGHYACAGGDWDQSECVGQVRPEPREECDGLDNDCDGATDERPVGDGPLARSCYSGAPETRGQGLCVDGSQRCEAGAWEEACPGEVLPTEEVCSAVDEDCNGEVDDPPDLTCGQGRCTNIVAACAGGQDRVCEPLLANARDERCDGEDDDCDGVVDNAPDVTCGEGRCEVSVVACVAGADNECAPDEGRAEAETCDAVDDDCDGEVDEGPEHGAPMVSPCYGGPEDTEGVGLCVGGVSTCEAGEFGLCLGEVTPTEEGCAAEDRDCDGQLDNGLTPALTCAPGGGYAEGAAGVALGRGDFTIEAWVRRDVAGPDVHETVFSQALADGERLFLRVAAATGLPEVVLSGPAPGASVQGAVEIPLGAWAHVAVERWRGHLRLYVQGVADGVAEIDPATSLDPSGPWSLCADRAGAGSGWSGAIDEARVSRGARYRGAAFLPSERLVDDGAVAHLWRFNEGQGVVAADAGAVGLELAVQGEGLVADGVPDRRAYFQDGDGDGLGGGGAVLRACADPGVGWAETLGDCDDTQAGVGAPSFEDLDNGADDDCDGRPDAEDGVRVMDLRDPGGYVVVNTAGRSAFYLRNTDFTLEAWVKLEAYTTGVEAALISNRNLANQDAVGWQLGVGGWGAAEAARGRLLLTLDEGADEHVLASEAAVPLGRWVHVAATFASVDTRAHVWIDGEPQGQAVLVPVPFGRTLVHLGRDHSLGDVPTHAQLDDVRISTVRRWDEAFTPPRCVVSDNDTLTLWRFEEAAGDVLSEGDESDRAGLLRSGALRALAACEAKDAPLADCLSLLPLATDVCRDQAAACAGRASLGGAACAAWCQGQGLACAGAYQVDDLCGMTVALAGGCDEGAQEAVCACSR